MRSGRTGIANGANNLFMKALNLRAGCLETSQWRQTQREYCFLPLDIQMEAILLSIPQSSTVPMNFPPTTRTTIFRRIKVRGGHKNQRPLIQCHSLDRTAIAFTSINAPSRNGPQGTTVRAGLADPRMR